MLKQKIKIFLCIFLLLQAIFISPVLANPAKVADLSKGQKAPFAGVLISEDLASKLYLDSKFGPKECEIKIEERLSLNKLECKRDLDLLKAKIEIQKEKYENILEFRDNRIEFLEKNWNPRPWYESKSFWLSIGVVSGILVTIASGYALGQVK